MSPSPNENIDQYAAFRTLLYKRLTESGWCDQVRMIIRYEIKQSGNTLSINELVETVLPEARAMVPTAIKREMLQKVKSFLLEKAGYYDDDSSLK